MIELLIAIPVAIIISITGYYDAKEVIDRNTKWDM